MSSLAILASLMISAPAAADQSNDNMENKVVTALTTNDMGNGPVIEVDAFGLFSGASGLSFSNATGAAAVLVAPAVHVGWEWDQMAALIGAQFIFTGGTNGANGPLEIAIPLTFRRYLKPLALYSFSPFIEGDFDMNFYVPPGAGLAFGFGIQAGFGGEYIFARNFGLFGKALLSYQHLPTAFEGNNVSTDAIGIGGVLGILIHF